MKDGDRKMENARFLCEMGDGRWKKKKNK